MQQRRVRELRVSFGLSQERFARLVGVSTQTVRRWEHGLVKPLPIIAARLEEIRARSGATATRREGGLRVATGKDIEGAVELGMGGLFKGIGNLLELVEKMAEEGRERGGGTGEFEAMGGKVKGVYGFSVRVGLGGRPVIQQFGNIRETETGPTVAETREPLVDVLDEGGTVVVIAELPGVEEGDIKVEVDGDILELTAEGKERRYRKEVLLPAKVVPNSLKTSYRNGVLEASLAKLE